MQTNWTIHQIERKSDDGFVANIHWRYSMTDTVEDKKYYADTYGVATFKQDEESESYIPYEDLTDEIVISWVKDYLGEEKLKEIELNLSTQIEDQKKPTILGGLPWQTNEN